MFNEYFGFRENPFSENHDIDYFYLNNSNKQLYRDLLNDIYQRVDLTLLLADWGMGKTAFLQQLIGIDPYQINVIYFHDTSRWHRLVDYLCNELTLATDSHDLEEKEQLLVEHFSAIHQQGVIPVLIVDNTQELDDESLAPVLRLSGQRIEGNPLLQVILVAVPAFMARFDFPVLHPYKHSISRKYQLKALTPIDINEFISFRLSQAGCKRNNLFSARAVQAIADRSEGIPRLIIKLCGSALLLASLDDHQTVDEEIIDAASKLCFLNPDSVQNEEVNSTSTKNSLSNKIIPNFLNTHRSEEGLLNGKPVAKQSYLWSPQFIRYGSIAVLAFTILLAGMMLFKSEPEQEQKNIPTLADETIVSQDVVAPKNPGKIATIVTPKLTQPDVETSTITDKDRLINSEALVVDSADRNSILSNANSQLPKAKEKGIVQKLAPPDKIKKNLSHKPQSVPKTQSAQHERSDRSKPIMLDGREQQAKNRALARLKLKQSDIEFGIESLMIAADTADDKVLELLLAGGIPADIQEQTSGLTALTIAAVNGYSHIVQLLLSQQATTDARNFDGRTALMAAAGNGHADTVRVLLNSGAKVNLTDHDGWTALMFAAYSNHLETAQVLLEHGANDRLKNSVGRTALQIARSRGYQDIIKLVDDKPVSNR